MNPRTPPDPPAELFELPPALASFLERGGYRARLAILGRVDGNPLVDGDRRVIPALLRAALDTSTEGPAAADAIERQANGSVTWTPEARKTLDAMGVTGSKKPAKRPRRTK